MFDFEPTDASRAREEFIAKGFTFDDPAGHEFLVSKATTVAPGNRGVLASYFFADGSEAIRTADGVKEIVYIRGGVRKFPPLGDSLEIPPEVA